MADQQNDAKSETPGAPGDAPGSGASDAQTKPNRTGLAMLAMILAVFMAILDTSIVNVAVPKMMAVFSVSQTEIQWVLTAYSLVVGALIPITGYLGDRFGYKRVFVYSVLVFTIGSALCSAAWSNNSMIVFRIIQAIGGGAVMPVSMVMLFRMFPPEKRGMAMGMFGISVMFAPALGPTLSGYIVEYLDWRLIFSINVPIGIIDVFLAVSVLKEYKVDQPGKFDVWGFLTSSTGLATLLYGVGIVADKGWSDKEVVIYLTIAAVCLIAFVIIELNVKRPMLDLSLLKNFTFTITLLISSTAMVILMGSLFLLPVFLENVAGLSPIQTGLVLLPQAIVSGLMMPIAGALFDRIGAKPLAVIGMIITAYGLYLTRQLDVSTSFSTIIGWLMIRAVGVGLVMMPVQTAGMNTVPMHKMGQGTALSNAIRQVSASFGIAWLALMFSNQRIFHSAAMSDQMNMFSASVQSNVGQIQHQFMALGQTAGQAQTSAISYIYGQIQLQSTVQAMDDVFYMTAGLALVAVVLSLFMKTVKAPKGAPKEHVMGE
ncbi:DHA2 family efflux MFS transporter permease subunit [Paenibacillus piri]|uniref:DHA2 family efflux MFS transporter permease subunit n=1 Tax=Paenibacillus piri TaxID=2547395 RepID=A0A4V2ZTS8_9BACL|nr:DHA2 family efflux MFS transporter permease subunit [Paenibacillus piri]TDF98294.1 DHA2 family efflux MFS transporter permease subunit [Paenibacillus piri]